MISTFFKFDLVLDLLTLNLTFQGHKVKYLRSSPDDVPVMIYWTYMHMPVLYIHYIGPGAENQEEEEEKKKNMTKSMCLENKFSNTINMHSIQH